ncbi:MAG: hypothetical protein JRN20_07880 [Nitrososphaerota archaeon]|nr:hypothetical protein [Nitrososphaerota archaeon]
MNATAKSVRLRRAISLRIAALIVVALIIAVGFGMYFSTVLNDGSSGSRSINPGGTSTFSTQTTTTSENFPTSANTTNSTLGLELVLSTNATAIMSGQEINVSVDIFNTLSTVNNVTGASNWAIPSIQDATSFPCPTYLYYQVYPGYYTATNISSASPLQISPVEQYLSCPIFQRSYYLMQPHISVASVPVGISTVNSSIQYQNVEMSVTSELIGNYSTTYNASVFTPNGALPPPAFRPCTYTLAAGDEWGQLVILHFSVEPNPMTTTTYSTSNSSTFLQNSSTQTPSSEETFNYATMPTSFKLGNYSFEMIYNGTGYEYSANGTGYMNMGFNLVLNVTSVQSGSSATVDFGWAPPAPEPNSLPTPSTASLFNGSVLMNWNSNTTGSSGTFLTVWIFSNVPNPSTSNSTSTMTAACTTTTTTFVNVTVTQTATECVQ